MSLTMTYSPSTPFDEYLRGEQIKYPELRLDDIRTLKESLADDDKLPHISDKKYLAFLHSCHFDIELAKKTIRKYYRFHFDIPQVFCESDPLSEDIEKNHNCVSVCQMPTASVDKTDRIIYLQFKDYNHESFDYISLYKYLTMWMNYTLLLYGTCDGVVAVVDSKGLNWRHILKVPIAVTTKMIKFMEVGLPIRIKKIHVLNAGSSAQMLLKIVQKFANQELIEKIQIYPVGSEEIFNCVPRKIMPLEMGGLGKSHNYFNDQLYNSMVDVRDVFLEQNEALNNHMMYMNRQHVEDNE